ncbi:hypothetical protein [Proteus penneri]|uniref:Uncharacterized protein n=1 Tax=Proteus penneri TaxID=102862 RepID=A0A0G4Q7U1_9GAMM|nr:hypothetical protein [Proteus penneri]CRL61671.1 hypothetical protein BN1804_01586 [Proteus penneri]
MGVSGITKKVNTAISNVKINLDNKWINLKSLKSIKNTNLTINYSYNNKGKHIPLLPIFEYIDACTNLLNKTRESKLVSKENNLSKFDDLAKELQKLANDDKEDQTIEKEENKLPDWITNSGKEALNTNQKLYFKTEKTRSFKNLLIFFISPFKFINRSLLPVRINLQNKGVNKALQEFKFDNALNSKEVFEKFSNKLNFLNQTFTDNVNQVITKKTNSNNKIDIMIKYQTLEKALECKLINDIKLIKDELKADLAKNKFQENYSDLPNKIVNELNSISNSNIDELFSSNKIDYLKKLIKEKVNSHNKGVKLGAFFDNIVDSIFNEKNKLEIIQNSHGNLEDAKKELSLNITKALFNYLSKDEEFIGEEKSISKVDNLIRMVSKDIYKNMGDPTEKTINSLNNSFYENIKKNDNVNNLFSRLFKNSSNNINYKWAQDAIILLISYETFENKKNVTTDYYNQGVVTQGGNGTINTQSTVIENKLKGIFSRLGLSIDDLDKSKDEVLRKYFSNYFEHI